MNKNRRHNDTDPDKVAVLFALVVAGCAAALLSHRAHAEEVTPTIDVTAVHLEVHWVTTDAELAAARAALGNRANVGPLKGRETGFSVLSKHDGAYVCNLYVRKPTRVDDQSTLVLGHELAHCLLGAYHD